MAIENLDDILISDAEKTKIKNNSAFSLPLNPTAQGWSAQKLEKNFIALFVQKAVV